MPAKETLRHAMEAGADFIIILGTEIVADEMLEVVENFQDVVLWTLQLRSVRLARRPITEVSLTDVFHLKNVHDMFTKVSSSIPTCTEFWWGDRNLLGKVLSLHQSETELLIVLEIRSKKSLEEVMFTHAPDKMIISTAIQAGTCKVKIFEIEVMANNNFELEILHILAMVIEVLETIFVNKNFKISNDRVGPTRSYISLSLLMASLAVGNLHVFLGPDDSKCNGYLHVRLYWIGFGLPANILEEYIRCLQCFTTASL